MHSTTSVILVAIILAVPLVGQESEPAADARAAAIKALESLSKGTLRFTGEVGVREPENAGPSMMGVLGPGGPGGGSAPFKGAVELLRTADGAILCASDSVLPGCAVFRHGDKYIKRSTNLAGESLDTDTLAGDVLSALHVPHLLEKARKATSWKSKPGKGEGMTMLFARVDVSLVGSAGDEPEGPMAEMAVLSRPQVMTVGLVIEVDGSGDVAKLGLEVLRSDPMATMSALLEDSGGMFDPADLEGLEPEEGARTMYSFTRADGQPSKRAAQLLSSLRAAAGK